MLLKSIKYSKTQKVNPKKEDGVEETNIWTYTFVLPETKEKQVVTTQAKFDGLAVGDGVDPEQIAKLVNGLVA